MVIYPYRQPAHYADLEELYRLVARLDADQERYVRPITVVDRKTQRSMEGDKAFLKFQHDTVERHSDLVAMWAVDTCPMWYSGLGAAFDAGRPGDVYWLIPGDFNYSSAIGKEVLGRLHDLPEIVLELQQDVCIGEISTEHSNSKQLIDTHGTFALLYNWFLEEAREIRQFTERPRSEFFAIGHDFLAEVLQHRWYAYEQTVVLLLQAAFTRRPICRFCVGSITDLLEGRESLSSALQQVERTERVLKTLWRERNHARPGWIDSYRALETQSEIIRRAAQCILQNLLQ
ncbi:MAG: hypothetical protein ACYC23_20170 [Limisphaerales bacterium]